MTEQLDTEEFKYLQTGGGLILFPELYPKLEMDTASELYLKGILTIIVLIKMI